MIEANIDAIFTDYGGTGLMYAYAF